VRAFSASSCETTTPSAHACALAASFTPRVRAVPSTRTTSFWSSTRRTSSARPCALSPSRATTTPQNPIDSTSARHAGMMLPAHGCHDSARSAGERAGRAVTPPAWPASSPTLPLSGSIKWQAFRPPCPEGVGARGSKGLDRRPRARIATRPATTFLRAFFPPCPWPHAAGSKTALSSAPVLCTNIGLCSTTLCPYMSCIVATTEIADT